MNCTNPECRGGRVEKIDLMKATKVYETCNVCGGTGIIPDKETVKEGLYVQRIPGMPFWMEWYEENILMSWAKIRVVTAMTDGKQHLVIEVDHIETKRKRRRQGLATNLVQQMMGMFDGEVKYIVTSWADSGDAERSLFKKLGFERQGKALVWNRDT